MASPFCAFAADTAVSGIVRDRTGTPQIDALVQLLRLDTSVAAIARTDDHGSFTMAHLLPGVYQLRATEVSFLPAVRERLRVTPNQRTVANITLSTLLDTIDWLPAQRRTASEPEDDWKWTLRSSANRPLLRFADDQLSPSSESGASATSVRFIVQGGTGDFGYGGQQGVVELRRDSPEGKRMLLRAATGAPSGGTTEVMAAFVQPLAPGRTLRTAASFSQQPVMVGAPSAQELQAMLLRTAESIQLSPELTAEFGDEIQAVRLGLNSGTASGIEQIASHPFGSIAWQSGSASVSYAVATAPGAQRGDELAGEDTVLPAATVSQGRLALEHGLHQEIRMARGFQHGAAATEFTFAAFNDRIEDPIINGGGSVSSADAVGGDLLLDPLAHALRAQGPAYGGAGWIAETTTRFEPADLVLSASYATGPALSVAESNQPASIERTLRALHGRTAQAVAVAASGKILPTGTRWRTSYRWQPSSTLTTVDPYDTSLRDAYLSLLLRQPMHLGKVFPGGTEAWVDVRNLLAQGYYPFLTSDGSTLYFAQMDRAIQGGIAFTF